MAGDLKSIMSKVLASGGEKKFFFAYGTGKRKDGRGEGNLVVQTTKPKKPDIEAELTPCKEFFEGFCWTGHGADDRKTVYFQSRGRPLGSTHVTKMKLTAKTTLGHQYDFQLPSPDEQARAEKLGETDAADATTGSEAADAKSGGEQPAELHEWQAACAEVKNQIRKVQVEIVKAKDANSTQATVRLESIIKNLATQPSTQQDVLEVERWIRDDDVITAVQERNPWNIAVTIRERLLPVLAALKPKLPA